MEQRVEYLHNHEEIMRSILAECAILMPRLEALDINAPDYEEQSMEFLDDFIAVGVNPLTEIINFIKAYHADDEEKYGRMVETGLAVGEIFRVMNEKSAVHKLLMGH